MYTILLGIHRILFSTKATQGNWNYVLSLFVGSLYTPVLVRLLISSQTFMNMRNGVRDTIVVITNRENR